MTSRAQLMEQSLTCFRYGAAGFLPLFGLIFSVVSLARFRFVVIETNDRRNPARRHLYLGLALAILSLLLHAVIALIIAIQIFRAYQNA